MVRWGVIPLIVLTVSALLFVGCGSSTKDASHPSQPSQPVCGVEKGVKTGAEGAKTGVVTAVEGVKTFGSATAGLVQGGTDEAKERWKEGAAQTKETAKKGAANTKEESEQSRCP